MDRALESERGITIECLSPGFATNLVQRIHQARRFDIDDAEKMYGDPEASAYTKIFCTKKGKVVKIWKGVCADVDAIVSVQDTPSGDTAEDEEIE